ncbi:MAG: sigma-70 family RNA polymerase sigma factor [Planctomycetota bacterium]
MGALKNDHFLKSIRSHTLLTADEEKELAYRIRAGDEDARQRMILANMRLVMSLAKSYVYTDLPLEELINEGTLGLMEAVHRFRPEEECRFSTYATWWIKQALRRAIRSHTGAVRIPPYMLEMIAKLKNTATSLSSLLGRTPTLSEIAVEMGVPSSKIETIQQAMHSTISANQPMVSGMEQTIVDGIEDRRFPSPEEQLFRRLDAGVLHRLLEGIGERDADVLRMRYGLNDGEPMTLKEIGKRMKLTKERVRQIESQAIRKLKRILRTYPGFGT